METNSRDELCDAIEKLRFCDAVETLGECIKGVSATDETKFSSLFRAALDPWSHMSLMARIAQHYVKQATAETSFSILNDVRCLVYVQMLLIALAW